MTIAIIKRNYEIAGLPPNDDAKRACPPSSFSALPKDIIRLIFGCIPKTTRHDSLKFVCKKWHHIVWEMSETLALKNAKTAPQRIERLRYVSTLPIISLHIFHENVTSMNLLKSWNTTFTKGFRNLKKLTIDRVAISSQLFKTIKESELAKQLAELHFIACSFQPIPYSSQPLPVLRTLTISPEGFETLNCCSLARDIQILSLENFAGGFSPVPPSLLKLTKLHKLNLINVRDTGSSPYQFLTAFKNLSSLSLSSQLSQSISSILRTLPLEHLRLSPQCDLAELDTISSLRSLDVDVRLLPPLSPGATPFAILPRLRVNREPILLETLMLGRYDLVEALIDGGADPNVLFEGHTLLSLFIDKRLSPLAPGESSLPGLLLLLKKGANVNVSDRWGRTPFTHALYRLKKLSAENLTRRTYLETVIKVFLANGADPNTLDPEGFHPLKITYPISEVLFKRLIEKGANPCAIDATGTSTLDTLFSPNSEILLNQAIWLLAHLRQGINYTVSDLNRIHTLALMTDYLPFYRDFLPTITMQNLVVILDTRLCLEAVSYNALNIARWCLEDPSIDINHQDYQGNTVLHRVHTPEMLAMILEKKPAILMNCEGKTPLDTIAEREETPTNKQLLWDLYQYIKTIPCYDTAPALQFPSVPFGHP